MFSSFALVALAAAQQVVATQTAKGGVQWVPLPQATTTQPAAAQPAPPAARPAPTAAPIAAQPAPSPVAAAPISVQPITNAILRVGTEVPLRLREQLTTKGKKLRVGHRFHLETSEPVMVNGVNVIPVGSPAVGEITDIRNKGMWGKSGHLALHSLLGISSLALPAT